MTEILLLVLIGAVVVLIREVRRLTVEVEVAAPEQKPVVFVQEAVNLSNGGPALQPGDKVISIRHQGNISHFEILRETDG